MSDPINLLIKQLILVGYRKNYVIPFNPGVNIIYGDSDTGKSSILELINYTLGASKFSIYEEIETSVRYVALEVVLNNKTYVIKRDIFDPSKLVEVYAASFAEIDKVFPEKYAASFRQAEGPSGYLSDFLLDAMNLPNLKVRQAPTKTDTKMIRLSFRDIFKYCYFDQEDVGSKYLLDINNWAVYTKNKQTFKYIFNLLDSAITDLESELADLSGSKKELEKKLNAVSDFLRETEFKSLEEIYQSSDAIEEQIEILEEELTNIQKSMIADSENYHALKEILQIIELKVRTAEDELINSENKIERFTRLKNDYLNDIEKINAILLAKQTIDRNHQEFMVCPICSHDLDIESIQENFQISHDDKLNHESNTLKRRVKDLQGMIDNEKNKYSTTTASLYGLKIDLDQARRMLDEESKEMITPYLTERDNILLKLATLKEKKNQTDITLKIRNQEEKIAYSIVKSQDKIDALKNKVRELQAQAPSLSDVLVELERYLEEYLTDINIKNRKNIRISDTTYLPILRGQNYNEISSGGLRTIISIGHFIGLLKYSLNHNTNLPRILMIDTVGKYLGKTAEKYVSETDLNEDKIENVGDPAKYKNIYEHIIDVSEYAEKNGKTCQIILVDNDVPPNIQQEYAGFIIAHFSSTGEGGLPIGLIDDANLL